MDSNADSTFKELIYGRLVSRTSGTGTKLRLSGFGHRVIEALHLCQLIRTASG